MALSLAPATAPRPPVNPKLLGRRALARVPMDAALRLQLGGLPGPLPARARDLGMGGLCIATPTRFELSELRRMTLLHPTEKLELDVEGRWQAEVPGRDAFLSGVRFLQLDTKSLDRLWDIVHDQTKYLSRWLSQHSILKALPLADLIQVIHSMRLRDVASGEMLYRQGVRQPGDDSIGVLVTGAVVLERASARGRKVMLGSVGRGDLFGGSALLSGAPPLESAIASEATQCLEISRGSLDFLEGACPSLAADLTSIATKACLERQATALDRAIDRG
jgi:CRP-like cAMP-binding protein